MRIKTRLPSPFPGIVAASFLVLSLAASSLLAAADPVAEMASFSAFGQVDLSELAKTDVKTATGVPMGQARYLSVQSCWVSPLTPDQVMAALHNWDPLKHKELKVSIHSALRPSSGVADFAKLHNAPDTNATRSLVAATNKMGSDVQVSKEEAKKFVPGGSGGGTVPANVADFWANLLNNRFHLFLSGGADAQPSYDHTGNNISPGREFSGLLSSQEKIRKQFSGFLGRIGLGHSGASSPDLFWELLEVDNKGVLTLGASFSRNNPYQAADVLYYSSGGYYVGLTLHQMWPVTVDGKNATLVWRGDLISSAEIASLHGVERLGSEAAMKKDIAKGVALFRRDSERGR